MKPSPDRPSDQGWDDVELGFFASAPPDVPEPPPAPPRFDDLEPAAPVRLRRSRRWWRARASGNALRGAAHPLRRAEDSGVPPRQRLRDHLTKVLAGGAKVLAGGAKVLTVGWHRSGLAVRNAGRAMGTTVRSVASAAARVGAVSAARPVGSRAGVAVASLLLVTAFSLVVAASRNAPHSAARLEPAPSASPPLCMSAVAEAVQPPAPTPPALEPTVAPPPVAPAPPKLVTAKHVTPKHITASKKPHHDPTVALGSRASRGNGAVLLFGPSRPPPRRQVSAPSVAAPRPFFSR